MPTVLTVGQDQFLLDTRVAIFRNMDLDATAANAHDAVGLLKARGFDLVVLCHTLSLEEMTLIARLAHRHNQGTHVLKLVSAIFRGAETDGNIDDETPSEPHKLVAKVKRILTN
jgi:hypothetical protein